jgi:hypothetical protein
MRKSIALAFLLFFSSILMAQDATVTSEAISQAFEKDCKELNKIAKKQMSADTIDSYIKNHPNYANSNVHYQWLLAVKVDVLQEIHKDEISLQPWSERFNFNKTQEIISVYEEAIMACDNCASNANYRLYKFLESQGIQYNYKPINLTRKKFYSQSKHSRKGIGFGLRYMQNNNTSWLGGDISLRSAYVVPNTKNVYDSISNTWTSNRKSFWSGYHLSILSLGYARSLSTDESEMTINGIQILHDITLKPLQFGKRWNNEVEFSSWFYRPEIGLTFSLFTFTAGYNIYFKSNNFTANSKLVLTAVVNYPIIKYKLKKNNFIQ